MNRIETATAQLIHFPTPSYRPEDGSQHSFHRCKEQITKGTTWLDRLFISMADPRSG